MDLTQTSYSVAQYCRGMEREEIVVNKDYQRSGEAWPQPARSFFIETILLGYPIPKLTLYQYTNLKNRETVYEIVDGQQRSQTILSYYNDRFQLSKSLDLEEAKGRSFSQLDEELQHRFLNYPISADLLLAATPKEIREMFRRINSYTIPLNDEEQRHAVFQGHFKWFTYRISRFCEGPFLSMGVFTTNQIVRMKDTKLLSEICHAMFNGIKTTNKTMLYDLYEKYDEEFDEEGSIERRIKRAIDRLTSLRELWKGPLMRPYQVYSLMLALIHMEEPIETLERIYEPTDPYKFDRDIVVSNLSALVEALEAPEELFEEADDMTEEVEGGREPEREDESEDEEKPGPQDNLAEERLLRFRTFVEASSKGTNVRPRRETRFWWMCRALRPEPL
jgi:hypothetical protein